MAEEGTAGTGTGRPATTIGGGRTIGVGTTDAVAGGIEEAIVAEIGVVSGSCDEAELVIGPCGCNIRNVKAWHSNLPPLQFLIDGGYGRRRRSEFASYEEERDWVE